MNDRVCAICGKERYAKTNAVTCGNKACQKDYNRFKMREYQRNHRAKVKAATSNPGDCEACSVKSEARRAVQYNGNTIQLCNRCHAMFHYLGWDWNYAKKITAAWAKMHIPREPQPVSPDPVV